VFDPLLAELQFGQGVFDGAAAVELTCLLHAVADLVGRQTLARRGQDFEDVLLTGR
jgi:hypothetical protein